jgi:hypothetical protein
VPTRPWVPLLALIAALGFGVVALVVRFGTA